MWNPYTEEHELFRKTVRQFAEKEIEPYADEWEKNKDFPSELFKKAGDLGILGAHYSEDVGGGGGDYWFSVAKAQELPRGRCAGVTMALLVQTDMATPVIADLGTPEQIDEFLKPALTGDRIASIGVSEPGAGSDVAGIRTVAKKDGGDYVLNGQKTFITNGARASFVTLLAKTNPDSCRPTPKASRSDASSRRSATTLPTPPSFSSRTFASPSAIGSVKRTWASCT
jgi:citronellyl-CoA dehydrogenase